MTASLFCSLVLAIAPAQEGKLQIVDARPTYGYLGGTRPKRGVVPGETLHFAFNVKGMKQDDKDRVSYSLLMEVLNSDGEKVFSLGPRNATARNFLGGDVIPCHAHLVVPVDRPPGIYSLRVTIEDRHTKQKAVFAAKGKIIPPRFQLINVGTFRDAAGKAPCAPVGVLGESLYVGFSLVGFARDKDKQTDIALALKFLDSKGKPTIQRPLSGVVKSTDEGKILPPLTVGFTLNRVGRFTVELQATDQISGKTSKVSFPIQVVSVP